MCLFGAVLVLCAFFTFSDSDKTANAAASVPDCPCHGSGAIALTAGGDLSAGNYYLQSDVTFSSTINFTGAVNLCLNGHRLTYTGTTYATYIYNAVFSLYDCGNDEDHKHYYTEDAKNGLYKFTDSVTDNYLTGGVITAAKSVSGDLINVSTNSTFNMYGGNIAGGSSENEIVYIRPPDVMNMFAGKICGNSSKKSAVCCELGATFNMSGGEIRNNRSSIEAGGIFVGGKLNLSGNAKVYDNTFNDKVCNIEIYSNVNSGITVTSDGLEEGARIGVTVDNYASGGFLTNNSNQDIDDLLNNYFFDDSGQSHVHNYGALNSATPATCSQPGMQAYYKCTVCNQYFNTAKKQVTYSSLVVTVPHTEVTDAAVAATCTAAGKTEGKHCSVCNTVITAQTDIPATGHTSVSDLPVAATCTENGKTSGSHCSVCNTVIIAQTIVPAKGHTEVTDPAVEATCTDEGKTEGKHCSVCKTILTPQAAIPANGHTEVTDAAVAATCTDNGLTEGVHCLVCNAVITEQGLIPATGHNYEKGETVEPTPTEAGYTEYTCSRCSDSFRSDIVPPEGHDYRISEVKQPTCTEQGYTTYTCADCNDSYNDNYVYALGHDYTTEVIAANCEKGGYLLHVCTRCGDSYETEHTEALGHDYGEPAWKWADNYFTATATFTCTRGDNYSIEISAEIDEEKTTATCTEAGDAMFIATVSFEGNTYTDAKEITGTTIPHKYEILKWDWNGKESATAIYACTVCKDSGEVSGEAVMEREEPTCDADGRITYTVTVEYPYLQEGKDTKEDVIPATGEHEYGLVEWRWREDYTAAVLDIKCVTCGTHKETEAEVTSTDEGETRTYTATVIIDGAEYTDIKTAAITEPDNPDRPTSIENAEFPWILILIGGLLLLLFIIALIVIFKRNRDDGEDAEYDYEEEDDEDDEEE